jgi:hypothetical protein
MSLADYWLCVFPCDKVAHVCCSFDQVIKVGSEEYKFSSAPEPGDLCDIYEEHRHGEDGNGVLKEAGSVWRKLSVLRILNASEKDRVKNRSKEAERQQKSRKYVFSISIP